MIDKTDIVLTRSYTDAEMKMLVANGADQTGGAKTLPVGGLFLPRAFQPFQDNSRFYEPTRGTFEGGVV